MIGTCHGVTRMPDYKEKPTAQLISSLHRHLADIWLPVHQKFEKVDEYYWGTFQLWEKGVDRGSYHPPRAAAIIDHAADALMAYKPIVKKMPAGSGEGQKERADSCEKPLAAIMEAAALLEPSLTWYMAGKYLGAYGYNVIEGPLLELKDRPQEPERKKGETEDEHNHRQVIYENERRAWMPIRIRAPHPGSVLMDPLEKQPSCALRLGIRYAQDLHELTKGKAAYGKQAQVYTPPDAASGFEPIRVLEFWSRYWHAMMELGSAETQVALSSEVGLPGQMLFIERNSMGFVPMAHAFAGFGMEMTNPGRFDPSPLAVSLLEPVMAALRQDAQRQSAAHNVIIESAWPHVGSRKDAVEAAAELSDEKAPLRGEPGDYWYLNFPDLPTSLDKMGMELVQGIQEGTYMRDVAGARQAGVNTVGQQQILKMAADRKFEKLRLQLNHEATIVGANILRMVDILGEGISVQSGGKVLSLTPKNIEHSYAVEVEFKSVDPLIQMQQRSQGAQEVAQGLKSAETWRESDAGIENEAEEKVRLNKERAEKTPAVAEELGLDALKEAGMKELAAKLEQETKARQSAPPSPNGPGPIPSGAGEPA